MATLSAGVVASSGATQAQAADRATVIVQAHRGGPALGAPENSLAAFRLALAEGVGRVELDVQITKDKVPVVNHEDKITDRSAFNFFGATIPKRDCTHDGQRIHEMTIEQVEQVRCGGEPIPTLAEVIDLFRGSGVPLNIEIKSWDEAKEPRASRQETANIVVRQLQDGGLGGQYVVSSFIWRDILPVVKKIDPSIYVIGFERVDDPDGKGPAKSIRQPGSSQYGVVREAASAGLDALGFNSNYAQASVVEFVNEMGLDLAMYELDTPAKVRFAIANGQRFVGSDNPVATRSLLNDISSSGSLPQLSDLQTKLTSLKSKKVYDKSMSKGKETNVQVIGKSGTAPASAQKGLKGIRLEVTVKSKKDSGNIVLGARNSATSTDVVIPFKKGTSKQTVMVSPGDKGQIRIRATAKADKVTVKVTGYEQYVLS